MLTDKMCVGAVNIQFFGTDSFRKSETKENTNINGNLCMSSIVAIELNSNE